MEEPLLPSMLDLQAQTGGIVLAFMEVKPEATSRYGIASVAPSRFGDDIVEVTGLVEKPAPEDAPSNLAVLGRYILPATIFDAIQNTKPGSGGEIQLTDAMAQLLTDGTPVHGIIYRGHRYDTGMPLGYLQAVVQLAVKRPDLGAEFRAWLGEFVGSPQG
jgi:UTP--glucose-1-phosphate uridylyltransferase